MLQKYSLYVVQTRLDNEASIAAIVKEINSYDLPIDLGNYKEYLYKHSNVTNIEIYDMLLKIFILEDEVLLVDIKIIKNIVTIELKATEGKIIWT